MARLTLLAFASAACGPAPSTPTDELQLCGGFGAIPCDPGFTCLDAPKDSCDAAKGDADCPGLCYSCDDPSLTRRYTSTSADQCLRLDVQCDGNDPVFSDSCGCGCAEREHLGVLLGPNAVRCTVMAPALPMLRPVCLSGRVTEGA